MNRARPDRALRRGARMLQASPAPDFTAAANEWRRLFAEIWGTFLLVVVACGAGVSAKLSGGAVTLGMAVTAPGLMVMAVIYFMGSVGGNPVRSLAPDLVRGDLGTAWIYLVGPFVGAIIAVGFEWILKGGPSLAGDAAAEGALPGPGAPPLRGGVEPRR